ncbi:D-arabinono-1,4-lactone oxidase [Saccharothrix syringae]|uniref:D-arabinono-1,4-lactone oxidase n=1 Tax=Saccharothrix syringae TaxID=103733 RepID=UPI000A9C5247|nr:D-arabinono-1,4-lactone oxidase [Saccharothrix syringae]
MSTNWAGNVTFSAARTEHPRSLDEVRDLVTGADTARVVGTGHSFSTVADTTGTLIALDGVPEVFETGPDSVRVGAGTRLARLAELLQARDLALPAMPSLPHITIAGACATATHGSGDRVASLASLVRAVELVTADGGTVRLARGEEDFDGAVVSFGTLGVVTAVELDVVPAFDVEQRVYEDMPFDALVEHVDAVFSSAYSVSAFTTWQGVAHVFTKRRTTDERPDLTWTGATEATRPHHPVPGQPTVHCTAQLGEPGPWHERLPHFRADFTPSVGAELQSEYFVAREHAADALKALAGLREHVTPVLLTSEVRTIAADTQWLSMVHGRDSVAFHFTWRPEDREVRAVLRRIEDALAPWDPRPHWGKLTELPDPAARYPRLDRFLDLRRRLDPTGKFGNALVNGWLNR